MWRSSKIHVSGELQLPPQEECFSWLIFSSIEEYFYKKQHATCMDHAHQIIRSLRNDTNRRESISGTLSTRSTILCFHINSSGSGFSCFSIENDPKKKLEWTFFKVDNIDGIPFRVRYG